MDTTALERLGDKELLGLAEAARGLPFGERVQAVIDARLEALIAERDRRNAKALTTGRDLAEEILIHQDADTKWFFVDQMIEDEDTWTRKVCRHALDALADAHFVKTHATFGRLHLKGVAGFTKDPTEAFRCFERGARGGDAMAMYYLGFCYERGIACEPDAFRALDWYEETRESWLLEPKTARARLFFRGFGLKGQRDALRGLHKAIKGFYERNWDNGTPLNGTVMRRSVIETVEDYMRQFGHIDLGE